LRNKREKEAMLRADLVKYCKQIGVIHCEIPELVFYGEEYKSKSLEGTTFKEYGQQPNRIGSRYTTYRGSCDPWSRLIFVNFRTRNRRDGTLRELREGLVHELVHYRFPYMSHGKTYEKRIRNILRGKQYPCKHIDIPNFEGSTGFV
jgi:hypothetical protein